MEQIDQGSKSSTTTLLPMALRRLIILFVPQFPQEIATCIIGSFRLYVNHSAESLSLVTVDENEHSGQLIIITSFIVIITIMMNRWASFDETFGEPDDVSWPQMSSLLLPYVVELAMIMDRLYGGVCYAGIDTDPELKYPKGAGRVAFSNQQSYIAAISARFVQLQHGEIDKRVSPGLPSAEFSAGPSVPCPSAQWVRLTWQQGDSWLVPIGSTRCKL